MREVFVDSGALVAVVHEPDANHRRARETYRSLLKNTPILTTNLVLSEVYTLLRSRAGWEIAFTFNQRFRQSHRVRIVYVDRDLDSAAEEILSRYREHQFSYVDAVSFAIMRARGIEEAFAFDKHFKIAGFRVIP